MVKSVKFEEFVEKVKAASRLEDMFKKIVLMQLKEEVFADMSEEEFREHLMAGWEAKIWTIIMGQPFIQKWPYLKVGFNKFYYLRFLE